MTDATGRTLSMEDRGPRAADRVTRAALYLCLECDRPLAGAARYLLDGVDEVVIGRGAARTGELERTGGRARLRLSIPDQRVSSLHARVARRDGVWLLEDAGSKNGVLVDGRPIERVALTDGLLVEIGKTFFLFRASVPVGEGAEPVFDATALRGWPAGMATLIPSLQLRFSQALQMALSPLPVMLFGESGTGKELIARALHDRSGRTGAFVAINCGALAPSLAESELFGYRRGAFSGATDDRPGLVRAADGGTLFLDEIGDLPASMQALLLRVLQEREVLPVGATRPIPVDLRVLSATHRDLEAMVDRGEVRADLYARLSGGTVRLPRLRDRIEDLGLLMANLLRRVAGDAAEGLRVSVQAARALYAHDWPLNVRELEQSLRAAYAVAVDGLIDLDGLPSRVRGRGLDRDRQPEQAREPLAVATPGELAAQLTGWDMDNRGRLIALLDQLGGNVSAVARRMGKGRTQIQRWMKRYRIKP